MLNLRTLLLVLSQPLQGDDGTSQRLLSICESSSLEARMLIQPCSAHCTVLCRAQRVTDLCDDLRGGRAQQVGDQLQLVNHVAAGEQRFAQQDLGEDASD